MKIFILMLLTNICWAENYVMPTSCNNLLPDMDEYVSFLENTADSFINQKSKLSEQVYQLLAIREIYQKDNTIDSSNPIDDLIKDKLCECYQENNNELFNANSPIIKKYLDKNISKIIKTAKQEYKTLKITKKMFANEEQKQTKNIKMIQYLKNKATIETVKNLSKI